MRNHFRNRKGAKAALVLLSMLLFLLLFAQSASAAMMGDVNGDGRIDVRDVVLVEKHVLEIPPLLTADQQAVADVNGDGVINILDVNLIMQYSLGMISEFPVGPPSPGTSVVKSVLAVDTDTIAVEFYQLPSEAEKGAITITIRNSINAVVPTSVTWEGNIARVSRPAGQTFHVGHYSVEVLGITPPYNGYVVVKAPSAVRVEIEATSLPVNTERAPLRVRLIDQNGNPLPILEITFDTTAYNLTTHTPVTINFDPRAQFFIDTRLRIPHVVNPVLPPPVPFQRHAFNVGDEIRVTFVHRATGLEETVILPVTPQVQLGSIEFGDVILPPNRTVLTRDLTNIRIPFTAKDQNGNPLVLVDGANVNLYSSEQTIIANRNLRFVWFEGRQYILIERFGNKGHVIVSVLGTPGGVLGNKFLNVQEGLPFELRVIAEPATFLLPSRIGILGGTSTTIRLRVVDQFGNPVLPTVADRDFELRTIKSSGADNILQSPLNNATYTLSRAGTLGIPIISADSPGRNDTITFRLQRRDGTFVDSIHRTIYVIEDFTRLEVTPDRRVYEAGESINVTIKAMLGNRIHEDYNKTGLAVISVKDAAGTTLETVNRNITFRDGVATTTVPAKVAGDNLRLAVQFSGREFEAVDRITVLTGPPSKFLIDAVYAGRTMTITLTDRQDNVIDLNEQWLLKVGYPEAYQNQARPPLDIEDRTRVTFVRGVATIVFNNDFVRGTYTVEDETGEIKGSRTLNP